MFRIGESSKSSQGKNAQALTISICEAFEKKPALNK
jgi:hypothetical protein